jgi:hypothetical protein
MALSTSITHQPLDMPDIVAGRQLYDIEFVPPSVGQLDEFARLCDKLVRNRQLLQVSAGLSGLTLYIGEDWHISFGDNLASLDEYGNVDKKYIAQYGPIKDFDRRTGEITESYPTEAMDTLFTT